MSRTRWNVLQCNTRSVLHYIETSRNRTYFNYVYGGLMERNIADAFDFMGS
jgi:hypothetical protein